MRIQHAGQIIKALWMILIIYWFVSGFGVKRPKKRYRSAGRIVTYIFAIGATWFLMSQRRRFYFPLLPINVVTQTIGILLCAAGVSFAIRARRILGRNWSGNIMIKHDHELIQSGPYALVRHPIYTGLILAIGGTVLALIPTVEGALVLWLWGFAFLVKARDEEHLLTSEFGEQYSNYKRRVKAALIPFVL